MDIEQVIKELNELKEKTEKKITILDISVFVLVFILIILLSKTITEKKVLLIVLIGICVFTILVGNTILSKKYKKSFKNTLIPLALKQFGDNITYNEKGIDKDLVYSTEMFGDFTSFSSEDTVSGKFNEVLFTSSDVRIGYYVSTGKTINYVPICHGQLYIFDFNKNFNTKTIITERSIAMPEECKKIKLESTVFNKQFRIYSDNEQETFYLLTPHFMEKLLELEKRHEGDLFIGLMNNKLHIGIHNDKDRFEPPLFSEFDKRTFDNQLDDLYLIKDIIEELKLNVKIFI
ncbi:MAG: hypothetical protein K0Q49_1986 [Haloplasmataceae bacterium]|jgi:hypothetical protein|nr:hypothetical protein [Haloplasmataceae bacterium]